MTTTIQETLLNLFDQVIEAPDLIPTVPADLWQEGSQEQHLLTSFRTMLERIQLSKQEAEAQLREKEEQYRSIFEATIDGLSINDLEDGSVLEANPALCRMYGYTFEEFINLPPTATLHPDSYHLAAEVLQKVKAGSQFQTRFVALRKDGSAFHAEGRGTPFIYKGKPHLLGSTRDITEQVEAEAQLREREEQYRSVFEATGDGLFVIDMDGFVVEANPMACRQLDYTYEEVIGLHRSAMVHPDYQFLVPEYLRVIQTGGEFQGRAIDVRKDGTTFPVEVLGRAFTYKGRPHTLSVVRDVTRQVQTEEQLREREAEYRSIFEATSDGLFITDADDGHLVEVNPTAYKMHGYDYQEFLALHPTAFIHPDSHPLFGEYLQTVKSGGRFHAQAIDFRKDGTLFPVEVYGISFIYRGKSHVLGIVRDITERIEAEKQLREREEQYRSVFEVTSDGLVIFDLDGFIVEGNPAYCNIFVYTHQEIIGKHGTTLFPPDRHSYLAGNLETLKIGSDFQTRVGRGLRKDGTLFYQESHGTPFTYKGKPAGLGVVRDITEQVQAQQLLEQRVEERTRELSTLLEVSHNVASTLELQSLLGLILEQLQIVADYDDATVAIVEGEALVITDYRGTGRESLLGWRFPLKELGLIWETISRQEVAIVEDVHGDTLLALAYRHAVGELQHTILAPTRAWMAVPMMLKERVIGVLILSSREPDFFTSRHATLALGIANQAAIAIENARLYAQAQELAALEERQKLARELHDSVSQALYGISLGAHAARTALQRDLEHVAEPLDYVLTLAEAALAEMRALIFELRPESLEAEGLVAALTKQAATTQARHELVVSTEFCDEPQLSLHTKQELYRIAQEAMHNIVKHAHASHVNLQLAQTFDEIMLEVSDNGTGFDTTASFPGHLGLHSMRERVAKLGGTFEIESTEGVGTRIGVRVPH